MTKYTPFDCLAVAETTQSKLLKVWEGEIQLCEVKDGELRSTEQMTALTADNQTDASKTDWIDRCSELSVIITTHRMVFMNSKRSARYLHLCNLFNMDTETMYFKSPKIVLTTAMGELVVAFTDGSDRSRRRDECHEHVQKSFSRKEWETTSTSKTSSTQRTASRRRVGVDAILNTHQKRHNQAKHLTDTAFEGDADRLLQEAKELVQIIHKYTTTLDRNDEQPDEFMQMLSGMGMASAQSAELDTTARQLADFIRPKLHTTAALTITDVYCLFNRARGTNLLSPEDLMAAVGRLQHLDLGIVVDRFEDSGLKVLKLKDAPGTQFVEMCNPCLSALDVSKRKKIPVVLAERQLQAAVQTGHIVRDEPSHGMVSYYPNKFDEWFEELEAKQ